MVGTNVVLLLMIGLKGPLLFLGMRIISELMLIFIWTLFYSYFLLAETRPTGENYAFYPPQMVKTVVL